MANLATVGFSWDYSFLSITLFSRIEAASPLQPAVPRYYHLAGHFAN